MSGKGYENGKYFEINRRGKLKESKALPVHKINAEMANNNSMGKYAHEEYAESTKRK